MRGLSELGSASYAADHAVALCSNGQLLWRDFLADVDATRAGLQAEAGSAWALFEPDTYRFAVALVALLAENCSVYLPGENHAGMVEVLQAESVSFIGEFSGLSCPQVTLSCAVEEPVPSNFNLGGDIVVFTSGSTGKPKAIPKSLLQIDEELRAQESFFGANMASGPIFSTVSHQHFYGLLFTVLWPLCAGRAFWRRPFIDPLIMAAETAALESAVWVMSPGHLHRLSADMPWSDLRKRVNIVFSSGGPLSAVAAQAVADGLGKPPWEVFGSSETGGIACRQQFFGGDPWSPLGPVEVRLGENNALMVRSPFLPNWEWYQSTDQASLDDDGRFVLGKRIDRIVKVEGKRVSLPEVEAALLDSEWVMDAHALTVERSRTVVAAVIVLTDVGISALVESGQQNLFRRLRSQLSSRLPALAVPRRWRILGTLPRNAQGKLVRARLESLFESRRIPNIIAEQNKEGGCVLTLYIDRSSPYFEGHFLQAAVLPGVVQIMWAERLARDYLGLTGEFSGMRGVKFKDIVSPGAVLALSLNYDSSQGRLDFRYESEQRQHSQGSLRYGVVP